MKNQTNHLRSVGVNLLVLLAFIGIALWFYGFISNSLKANIVKEPTLKAAIAKEPTIATFYLNGSVLHFNCLNSRKCFADVDLGAQIKEANNPLEHPLTIDYAYHGNDAYLYVFLSGSVWNYLAKVNLETSRAQILDLNTFLTPDGYSFPGMGMLAHNKIIVVFGVGKEEKVGILQDDFSLKIIALKDPVRDFIEANDSQVAFISQIQNEKKQEKVFLVDVNSGQVEEKDFNGPQAAGAMVTVDANMRYLYWVSADNEGYSIPSANPTLHRFDIQTQKDALSVPISASDGLIYTTLTEPRFQYHGIWYYSRRCPCEGPVMAMILNMSTLKPVVNPQELLKNESNTTFMVVPFGDNFLVGTNSRVLVVAPAGKVINTYNLPKEWVGRNYLLLEYRK